MGRPSHRPDPVTRRQVEAMAAYGVPEADIARVLAIDPKTLRKHYRDEFDPGAIKASSRVAESLYRKAVGDGAQSVTAAIFWLKTRAQWKETQVQEHRLGGRLAEELSDEDLMRIAGGRPFPERRTGHAGGARATLSLPSDRG